jgi:tetratricopeptide (TPR) repeat protein
VKGFVPVGLFLLCCGTISAAAPVSLFEKGVDAYRRGDTLQALQAWESALEQGYESGALYYDLGNVHYRLRNTAEAILFFERAKRLLPRDRDVAANLSFARLAVVDRVEGPPRLIIWKWVDGVRDYFSLRELRLLFIWLGVISAAAVIALFLFSGRLAPAIPTAIIVVWLLSGALFAWRAVLDSKPYAIITVAKVDVKSAPDEASKDVFALHEGFKVRVKANLADWLNIELVDGRQGWIPVTEAEQI